MLLVSQRVEAPRMEAHISLQGSIKRKLDDDSSPISGGMPDVIFASDNKRLCLDDVTLSMGHAQGASPGVSCPEMQHSPFSSNHSTPSMGVTGHSVLLENSHMNGSGIGSPFSVASSTGMGPKGPVGDHNSIVPYDEKGNNMQSMDQDLQDLLEELTKMPDPSPNEIDLDKILGGKPEESLCMSHPQPNISTTPKPSPQTSSHLENHLTSKDFSPGCNPGGAGSPQMRPSSAGTSYSVQPSGKPVPPSIQNKSQLPVNMANMPGSNWHAQQLKQLAASKQISSTKQQVPGPSWPSMSPPGLSPPYRAGSSPHHQPFSPQNVIVSGIQGNNIQSPQNTLLSSITSTSTSSSGPSPPYGSEKMSSPAMNQQPFSPQSSMLSNMAPTSIPANNIKSPQNLVSSITTTSTGPSPPYRPEKLSSPALHQQPFSPQNTMLPNITPSSNPPSMQSSLYKSMSTNQSKSMNMIMQQSSNGLQSSLVNENTVTQDQFSFNNTKPLSHFAPDSAPQKMSMSTGSRQQSLIHYLQQQQQQQQQQVAPVTQHPQQVSSTQFLQQHLRQLMQPQGMPRHMQPTGLPSQVRQRMQFENQTYSGNVWDLEVQEKPASFCGDDEEQNPGLVPRLHEPGSVPSAGSGAAPPTANGYMRNAILKEQIIRRQLLQVKQRPNMMGVTSEQRNAFAPQQMNPYQGVQQPMPTDCIQPIPNPPPHRMMASAQGMLQNTMGSGISPTTANQTSGAMVMIPHNSGKQQGMYPGNSDFNIPLRQSQNSLGMSSGCQTVHSQSAARPGMTLSGFAPNSLANHTAAQHQSRQPSMPRISSVYPNSSSQMWTTPGLSRMPNQNQMDATMQQFSNNPLFSKQNVRPNVTGQQFSHQAVVPPNQVAPGVHIRQMQKLSTAQSSQGMASLNSQNIRNSMSRGQLSGINVMKPIPQSVPGYNQISPAHLGPPAYSTSTGQSSVTFDRMGSAAELPQYSFVPQQSNPALSGHCTEADFIDCLMKSSSSNDEDWLNNLTMLDDILGQHTQNSGHV